VGVSAEYARVGDVDVDVGAACFGNLFGQLANVLDDFDAGGEDDLEKGIVRKSLMS
jgi:hypothetical protein